MEDNIFLIQYHSLNVSNYQDAWDFQKILHNEIKSQKRKNAQLATSKVKTNWVNHLVFCEHSPVITLGKSGKESNIKTSIVEMNAQNIEFHKINRGGDITYHGPGQITGYLIFDLELLYRDVHRFVRTIELCIIKLLAEYNITGEQLSDYTGVWIQKESGYKKICAIGVHLSRWVSMHGFALNVNTNLDHFDHIVPCGITDSNKDITNLSIELGKHIDIEEVKLKLKNIMIEEFGGLELE